MDPPLDPELELRAHIRGLLLQYALTHLATNYVTWTQEAVTDLLSESLALAPIRFPIEVTLPIDPFQQLSQTWNLSKLDLYEEHWVVDGADVLSYLKRQLVVPPGTGVSEKLWGSDIDEDFDIFLLGRPMSPILTCRSRRETPLFGKNTFAAKFPQNNGEMLKTSRIYVTEEVAFDEVDANMDDALKNKLEIDAESHQAVLKLIKSVPTLSAPTATISTTRHSEEFFRMETPPPEIIEPQEVPIFPRNQQPGRIFTRPDLGKPHSIASVEALTKAPYSWLSTVTVKDEEDDDIANEHLKLAGGWDGFKTPSSPLTLGTPSLVDSFSDAGDPFLPSSSHGSLEEEFSLMEEFQLPQTERFGGRNSKPSRLGEGQSLSFFITSFVSLSQAPGPPLVRSPKSPTPSPHTHISMSILSQLPSETMGTPATDVDPIRLSTRGNEIPSSGDSVTFATNVVERACGGFLGDDDPYSLILGEKIDEKGGHLMDVPTLLPPNEHDASACMPTRLSDLVASLVPTTSHGSFPSVCLGRCTGFLKKAKGLQSLQLELSWIPFKYGRVVPTDEEVADVANNISAQLVEAIDLPQDDIMSRLSEFLNDGLLFSGSSQSSTIVDPSALVWFLDDELDISIYSSPDDDIGLVLTRNDRLRLSGRPPLLDWNPDEDTNSNDDEDANGSVTSPLERPTKRVRFQDVEELEDAARIVFEEVINKAAYTVDSGVFPASSDPNVDVDGEAYANSFMQMAYDAKAFDSSGADGNLFLDIDPIHCGRDDPDLALVHLADHSGTSSFPITQHSHNHVFTRTSLERPHTTHIRPMVADEPSPEYPFQDLRASSSSPLEIVPLASSSVVPAAISCISPKPHSEAETMIKEGGQRAPSESSAATAIPVVSARQYLAVYLTLRGKASVLRPDIQPSSFTAITLTDTLAAPSSGPRYTPPELFDDRTLVLPNRLSCPATEHAYMASLSLVQKRALVRELASCCAVGLVERERLGYSNTSSGAMSDSEDLILDCDTAVLFVPLELLPAHSAGLLALLTRLSWRYAHLLVVFACYPSAWDYFGDAKRSGADGPVASVWSPPVVKAVRNLKRNLSIAEGLQTKCEACVVEYAFANTLGEAAAFARMYGDLAEARDATGGDVWGERHWLTHEERDGEYDLCGVDGMNLFASCLLLSQASLEDFLEKSPEDRVLEYGTVVGVDRIARFNDEMARRLEAMQLPPSSPMDTVSSLHSVPVLDDGEKGSLH